MIDFLDAPGPDVTIGIDLGGTNLRAALYRGLTHAACARARGDTDAGYETLCELREDVGSERSPFSVVDRLVGVIRDMCKRTGTDMATVPIGLGFAGMLEGSGGFVKNSPHLGWREVPFGRLVRDQLGGRRVAIHNDVNAVTFGEYAIGAAADATDVLAVFVGTGIGGGLVENGRLVEGATGCAAEIGHFKVVFDERGRECACGLRGCVEAYAGGFALQRRARAELRGGARSLAVTLAGAAGKVNPGHLDMAAERGDDYALDLFAEVAPYLGVALANAITLTNPSHVILGGGMLSRTPVFREHVIAALEVAVNPPALAHLTIADAALGDHAGTVGAALLGSQAATGQP